MFEEEEIDETNYWISFTDLVTGFMIVFMVITFLLYVLANEKIDKSTTEVIVTKDSLIQQAKIIDSLENRANSKGIYYALTDQFETSFASYDAIDVIDKEGTIRFKDEKNTFFRNGAYRPTTKMRGLLNKFIPNYFDEIYKLYEDEEMRTKIEEIRIEGHTSSVGKYARNLKLSNDRAYKVMQFITRSSHFKNKPLAFQEFIKEKTIACGFANSRPLGEDGNRVKDRKLEDYSKSRRVEFRLILDSKN